MSNTIVVGKGKAICGKCKRTIVVVVDDDGARHELDPETTRSIAYTPAIIPVKPVKLILVRQLHSSSCLRYQLEAERAELRNARAKYQAEQEREAKRAAKAKK